MASTTYNMTHNQPEEAAFLVYINGIEIPVQGATVRMGVGEYPSATITTAPDANLIQLGAQDRVQVAIFYKDNHYSKSIGGAPDFRLMFDGDIVGWTYVTAAGQRQMRFSCVAHVEVLDHIHPDFVVGPDGAAQSAIAAYKGSASGTLLQTELTFPWSIFFFGLNPTNVGTVPLLGELVGDELAGEADAALKKATEDTKKKLDDDQMKGFIRRPYDIIANMLRAMCGTDVQALGSVVSSVFFSRHMRKVALPFRFLPSPLLETEVMADRGLSNVFPILKGVQDTVLLKAVQRKMSETGVSGTIWSTFQGVFQSMYYEILSISTSPIAQVEMTPNTANHGAVLGPPKWRTPAERDKDIQKKRDELVKKKIEEEKNRVANFYLELRDKMRGDPNADITEEELEKRLWEEYTRIEREVSADVGILAAAKDLDPQRPNILANNITKPQWLFGIPPACNVVFPSMITNLQFEENYTQQPTRVYVNDKFIPNNLNIRDKMRESLSTMAFAYPAAAKREMWKKDGNPVISGKNFLIWPDEFYIGPSISNTDLPEWMSLIKEEIDNNKSVEQEIAQKALDDMQGIQKIQNDNWIVAYNQVMLEMDKEDTTREDPLSPTDRSKQRNERIAKVEALLLKKLEAGEEFQVRLQTLKEQGIIKGTVNTVEDLRIALKLRADEGAAKKRYIQNVFARYEYHRQRSAARRGAATLTFDPYIVPGFSAMFFDYLAAGQHFTGYITDVTHSMSTRGMETSVSFVHGQTIDELVQEIYDARLGNNIDGVMEDLSSAPPQPVAALRDVMQTMDRAEEYFSLLFHRGDKYKGKIKSCAFDVMDAIRFSVEGVTKPWHASFKDVFYDEIKQQQKKRKEKEEKIEAEFQEEFSAMVAAQMVSVANEIDAIFETDPETSVDKDLMIESRIRDQELALRQKYELERIKLELTVPKGRVPNKILDNYTGIVPSNKYRDMFGIHDFAMRYVSRPICTLDEYINFRGKWGTRSKYVPWNDKIQGKGAGYYERILNLKQGPGDAPTFDENNYLITPAAKDLPDTRMDWNTRLLNYRKKVLFGKAPAESVGEPGSYKTSKSTEEPESVKDSYAVTGVASDDVLNVRATANWRSQKVGELAADATGIKRASSSSSGSWWKITSPRGWVNSRYLKKES